MLIVQDIVSGTNTKINYESIHNNINNLTQHNWSTMIEIMNFHKNVHVKAIRFTNLFQKILHGMYFVNNKCILIMVVRIKY